MSHSESKDKTVLVSMISALFSGQISRVMAFPFDTIKAKIQVDSSYTGILNIAKSTYKHEGIRGFYKGLPIALLGSIPGVVIYFGSYEYAKKKMLLFKNFSNSEFITYFVSGIFAEIVACIFFVPVDVIKERRQVQTSLKSFNYKSDFDAFNNIMKHEKLRGLYKAYGATVCSFGPFSAFYFMFYEYFKGFFVRNDAKTYIKRVKKEDLNTLKEMKLDISFWQSLIASACAGSLASFITNPLDLVKLRMQVQRADVKYNKDDLIYKNMIQGLIMIYKHEGMRGLFKGSLARILYHTPSSAISMGFVEIFKPSIRKLIKEEI